MVAETNGVARRTARAGADFVDLYLYWLTRSLREVAPRTRGRLLDVGCGDRRFEPIFSPFIEEYVGVEHEAVFATTNASTRSAGATLLYDGKHLPFDASSFDTVISTEVLEHTPDPAALVAEMARVLRPDGTLIITTPFAMRLHEEPYDYFRFTPHGLSSLVGRTGLAVKDTLAFGGVFSVVGHKLNSYLAIRLGRLQGLGQALGKAGHEPTERGGPRWWLLPVVAPSMVCLAATARALDRIAKDPTEALGYLVVARKDAH